MKTTITISKDDVASIIKEYIKGKTGLDAKVENIRFVLSEHSDDPRERSITYRFKEIVISDLDINKF